jgi:hypothetical protein
VTLAVAPVGAAGAAPVSPKPPSSAAEDFVRGVYVAVFGSGRTPDASGLAYWVGRLATGTSAETVADLIARTPEANRRLVTIDYNAWFGRNPDSSGMATYAGLLNTGSPASFVLTRLLGSPEFFDRVNGSDATAMVNYLYDNEFGRTPSAPELGYWLGRMPDPTESWQRKAAVASMAATAEWFKWDALDGFQAACDSFLGLPTVDQLNTVRSTWGNSGHNVLRVAAYIYAVGACPA